MKKTPAVNIPKGIFKNAHKNRTGLVHSFFWIHAEWRKRITQIFKHAELFDLKAVLCDLKRVRCTRMEYCVTSQMYCATCLSAYYVWTILFKVLKPFRPYCLTFSGVLYDIWAVSAHPDSLPRRIPGPEWFLSLWTHQVFSVAGHPRVIIRATSPRKRRVVN